MKLGRFLVSAVSAFAVVACGGGSGTDNRTGGKPSPTPTSQPPAANDCSLAARKTWVSQQLNEYYLYPNLIDNTVDPAAYSDLQSYIDALVAPARAEGRDNFFTYITSIEEENELINSGSNAGFGIRLAFDENDRLFVTEAFENAPGFSAGLDRGVQITAIQGRSVAARLADGTLDSSLGPPEPGVTRTFQIIDNSGVSREISVTKAEYNLDPVSDRYGVRIFNDGGRQVGYLNLRTFIAETAEDDLRAAFAQFRSAGVTEVILDLRYNGGGLVRLAELLGDLLARNRTNQVFSRTEFSEALSSENSTYRFQSQPEAIDVTKLAVIGTRSTASASELVTNAFIPYLGDNLALIGSNTYGKPVGQIAVDREACDDRFRIVAFRTVNADGNGDYFGGLGSVVPNFCRADDEIAVQLGNATEDSISTALDFLGGRGCPATASVPGQQGARSVAPTLEALQPARPNRLQREAPALY
ncbi:peptidase S41 [Altererythrobacter aurantiacus]|uniref:Peptidase S41 n=1 Tax=Parapontixanthobacter aurantiacus TaxID=1463599 RepID=A0A844ZDI1_9SPHN|nr:S41 family peptidase [Parapontixanthobacter aurantiacus]MXO85935.1 peptidase S41 [Parapontixanthobacter aurantiacus]